MSTTKDPSFSKYIECRTTEGDRKTDVTIVVPSGSPDQITIMLSSRGMMTIFSVQPHEALLIAAALRAAWDSTLVGPAATIEAGRAA